jgi:hypothetical protein
LINIRMHFLTDFFARLQAHHYELGMLAMNNTWRK